MSTVNIALQGHQRYVLPSGQPEYVLVCKATDELPTNGAPRDETLSTLPDKYRETVTRKIILMIARFDITCLARFLDGRRVQLETADKIGTATSPLGINSTIRRHFHSVAQLGGLSHEQGVASGPQPGCFRANARHP